MRSTTGIEGASTGTADQAVATGLVGHFGKGFVILLVSLGVLFVGAIVATAFVVTAVLRTEDSAGSAHPTDEVHEPGDAPAQPRASYYDGVEVAWRIRAEDLVDVPQGKVARFATRFADDEWGDFIGHPASPVARGSHWLVQVAILNADEVGNPPFQYGEVTLVAIDPQTGDAGWSKPGLRFCQPIGELYMSCLDHGSGLPLIIDGDSGNVLKQGAAESQYEVVGDTLLEWNTSGVTASEFPSGRQLWTVPLDLDEWAVSFYAYQDVVYVLYESFHEVQIDVRTGEVIAAGYFPDVLNLNGEYVWVEGFEEVDLGPSVRVHSRIDSTADLAVKGTTSSHWLAVSDSWIRERDVNTGEYLWSVDTPGIAAMIDAVLDRDGEGRLVATVREWETGTISQLISFTEGGAAALVWGFESPLEEFTKPDVLDPTGIVMFGHGDVVEAHDVFAGTRLWTLRTEGEYLLSQPPGGLVSMSHDRTTLVAYGPATPTVTRVVRIDDEAIDIPSDVPDCPAGTLLLAWAELDDGWVIVCGYTLSEPTYWAMNVPAYGFVESESVIWDSASVGYRAVLPGGAQAWLDHTPAVLGVAAPGGNTEVQRSVVIIIFVQIGRGGESLGTGAYDVPAPSQTAEDQVRYLNAILRSSEAARAALSPAVIAVRECTSPNGDYSEQIRAIESVRNNRAQLLAAIRSAPVDLVPQGTLLIDELAAALTASYNADVAYLEWAKAVHDQGCGAGSESGGAAFSQEAGVAKEAFAARWNSVIAPAFAVPTVSRANL